MCNNKHWIMFQGSFAQPGNTFYRMSMLRADMGALASAGLRRHYDCASCCAAQISIQLHHAQSPGAPWAQPWKAPLALPAPDQAAPAARRPGSAQAAPGAALSTGSSAGKRKAPPLVAQRVGRSPAHNKASAGGMYSIPQSVIFTAAWLHVSFFYFQIFLQHSSAGKTCGSFAACLGGAW